MSVTKRGSILPFLQNEVWDFDPTRGYIYRRDFRGASQAAMLSLQQDYVRGGIACRLIWNQGDTATLEVEDATQQYTLDVWQLLGNEEARDGLSHPKLVGIASDDQISEMRKKLENNVSPGEVFADTTTLHDGTKLSQLDGTSAPFFYILQQRGSTDYRRGQYVLRHATNAPQNWNVNIADYGVGNIYTPAQLLSEVQDGTLWIKTIPGRLAYKIANIPVPDFRTGYQWGWLKGPSTETTVANNRIEINTEYTLEQWSTAYYDPL